MLRGIARYVRESGPWSLHLEAREQQFIEGWEPKWLNDWKGHGIIARCDTRAMVNAMSRTRVPVVDVLGDASDCSFPLVHVDDAAVAQLAAQHLLDRGFRRFGFVARPNEPWSEKRLAAFCAAVARYNCTCEVLQAPDFETMPEAWDDLIDQAVQWSQKQHKPLGLMLCSHRVGPLVTEACTQARERVPEDG